MRLPVPQFIEIKINFVPFLINEHKYLGSWNYEVNLFFSLDSIPAA
jgi:hypothetical protein